MNSSLVNILVLLGMSAFFSCMEAVFVSMDRVIVRRFQHSDGLLERIISRHLHNLDSFIVSTLLGNLIINIAIVWYTQDFVRQMFPFLHGNMGSIVVILLQTLFLLVCCDIIPKRLGIQYSQFLSYGGAVPMFFFCGLTYPISRVLLVTRNWIETIIQKGEAISGAEQEEHEILEYIRSSHEQGILGESEGNVLYNFVAYREAFIDAVLVPRMKMEGFDLNHLPIDFLEKVLQFPHDVIPIYNGVTDHIVGVLDKRRLFLKGNIKNLQKSTLKKWMDPPYIIADSLKLVDAFLQMYEKGIKLSVVVDEYGGVAGIVRYQDIFSLLLGRFTPVEQRSLHHKKDECLSVDGSVDLVQFNKIFATSLHSHKAHTVGGYILELAGDIPIKGDTFEVEGIQLCVEEVTKRGIRLLKAQRKG